MSGGGIRSTVAEPRHYADFAEALAAALLAPPDQPVGARYQITFR
jgi:hypothetical protein